MSEHKSDLVDISAEIRGETEKAWRLFDGKTAVKANARYHLKNRAAAKGER